MTNPRQHMEASPRNAPSLLEEAVQTRQALEQLKAQLHESEERYRLLFDSLDAGYCVIEKVGGEAGELLDFRYVETNPAFTAQTGLRDVLGKTLRQVLPDEFEERIRTYDAIHRTGEPVRFQREFTAQGRVLELYAFRVDDQPQGRVAINLQDITGRKQAEALVARQAAELELLYAAAPVGLFFFDTDLRFVRINQQMADINGLSIEQHIGMHLREIVTPELADALEPLFRQVLATGQPIVEYEVQGATAARADETNRHWLVSYHRAQAQDGTILGLHGVVLEITQRKQAEEALRVNEQRWRIALEVSGLGAWELNLTDHTAWRSLRHDQIFGYAELLPEWTFEMALQHVLEEDRPLMAGSFERAMAEHTDWSFECRIRRADGPVRWIWAYGESIHDVDGRPVRILGLVSDITERKQAEEAVRESEAFSRSIIKSSPDCIKVLNLQGDLISMESGQELLDIEDIRPFLNKSWLDFWEGTGDRRAAQAAVAAAAAGGRASFVGFFRTLRGEPKWWDVALSPILDADGQPARLLAVSRDVTQRQQADDVLRRRTAQFETLLNEAPVGIYLVDADFRIKHVNPAGLSKFVGIPDLIGRDFAEVMHIVWPQAQADEAIQQFRHTLATGEACFVPEMIERRADRQTTEYYDWQINRIPLPDGRHGVVCYFRDISERVLAQRQIRDSEERYRGLFNSMDEGFCVIEIIFDAHEKPIDYRFLEVNPAFAQQTGLLDVMGKRVRELGPDQEAQDIEIYGQVLLTGEPCRFVNKAKALDRWFDVYAVRLGGSENRKVAVVFNNITARKEAEEALRQSDERFRALLNSGAVAIYSCDRAGNILEINRTAIDLWGREPRPGETDAQFRGSFNSQRSDGTRLPYAETWMTRVLNGEIVAARNQEVSNERPDGSRVRVIVNVVPVTNQQGELTGAMVCFYDITERSRLERESQEQAQALADVDRRKDEFLAMLSHELRNPLAALSNAAQLLRLQKSEEPLLLQGRSIIERQLGHLTHLVDDLLEVARINSGSVRLRQQTVNLSGIVERALETAQPMILQHRHQLTLALPPAPIFLHADTVRLEQVLVNLLTNAAKYTDDGGRIDLSVEQEDDQVVIRVRDNGIGIEPALLPHIFDLFTQAERSLDRAQGGLGIGLSLVRRLVELHGGSVLAHSVLGQGSEFVVRLPLLPLLLTTLPESPTALTSPAPASASAAPPKKAATGCRVLVVDDNVDAAQSMAKLLERTGHAARLAYDGTSALQAAIAIDYRPEVVLLDIGLPGLDGYEVAERIRQQDALKNVVLVALTGYGQDSDRQRSQEAGFDHHLVKPSDFDEIENILAGVVSLRKA